MIGEQRARDAFRIVALGLMEWEDPPEPELHRDVKRYLSFWGELDRTPEPTIYRPHCQQDDVEAYDLDASDSEHDI